MNLDKTSVILKKINRLYELISTLGEASSTESDLLKAYVVDLYEAVAMSDIEDPIDLDKEEMKKKLKKQKKTEKKLKKEILKKNITIEDEEENETEEEETDEEFSFVVENPNIQDIPEDKEQASEVPVEAAAKTSEKKEDNSNFSEELIELFNISNSNELSDRLANAPILDLTKAMGINEKVFTVKELFGGDQKEMDNIMLAMNGLDSFNEAKAVLMKSVAQKYDWTKSSKTKKAKNFIKLVKRRFN